MQLSIKHKKPVGNGVITCFNIKQARDRIKNGAEASFTAVGLKEGGMGLMALKPDMLAESQCLIAEQKEVLDEVRKAAEKIMNGSLEIKDPMFAN